MNETKDKITEPETDQQLTLLGGRKGSANLSVHFQSTSNEWSTPDDLYCELNKRFKFTLDPCCTNENAKCLKHFTSKENGLIQDWSKDIVFMNPPYGREIGKWIRKAYEESRKGATVVCLIAARTDTSYWHGSIESMPLYSTRKYI